MMSRSNSAVAALAFVAWPTAGVAQSPSPRLVEPGDAFPELEVYDGAGNSFNTKSLKGYYAVIVNGCLT